LRIAVAIASPVWASAALTWSNRQVDLTQLNGVFHFTNSGETPVTITDIHTSCGCTTAELAKRTYAPGETGEITAIYTVGNAKGRQSKIVNVTTDDAPAKPVELTLQVTIPDEIVYSPRMLLWRVGDKLDEKTVVITSPTSRKITRVEVQSITPEKEAVTRIESSPDGDSFRLFTRPHLASKATQVTIACLATFADGGTETLTVYVLVR
jgi:hypothetical protein